MFFDRRFFVVGLDSKHRNLIIHKLPPRELNPLEADLRPVELRKGDVLFGPDRRSDFIYFPSGAVISFLGNTGEGGSAEVWSVGKEGVAGLSSAFGGTKPFRGVVQIPGMALVAATANFRRHFQKRGGFHDAVLQYCAYLLVQIAYIGICNNNHTIEQRFSRWLLMISDRAGSEELDFTQESIAAVLGTRRATISDAAATLRSQHLISYSPGTIRIESRRHLEKAACRCYAFINSRNCN